MLAAVVPMALLSLLPAVEAGAELGPPSEAGGGDNGFHGFAQFDTHAQGQLVTLTGFLNAFREDNSIVGGVSEINGPPGSSRNITALFFRGKGATFVYGVLGGQGGGRGTLPDPPPGEANAYYPTDPPEMTWSGPITGLGLPQVVDSRFHAKATETPTGRTEAAVTALSSPNFFKVGQATVVSHTEPVEGGVAAEAVSVLTQVEVGPLTIQNVVSRAYAFVPTTGDPKGIATTVVEGAKVGETPVQITDKGIVVTDRTNPLGQEAVNKAMADAGFPQTRLLPSVAQPGEDGSSVTTTAGTLEFIKHDEAFGASNPQGFSGGGFSIGGAEAFVNTRRCAPDCGGGGAGGGSEVTGGDTAGGSLPSGTSAESGFPSGSDSGTDELNAGYGANSTTTLTTDTSGSGLGSGFTSVSGPDSGSGLTGGSGVDTSSTTAVTPPGLGGTGGGAESAAAVNNGGVQVQQQAVAFTELGPETADWVRDLYLMAGLALGIIFVGQRLARAF
jgi:hypothetical protein